MAGSSSRGRSLGTVGCVILVLVLLGTALPTGAARAAASLPDDGSAFVVSFSLPAVTAGGQTALTFVLQNPLMTPVTRITFTAEVYAFNAFPGNATSPQPPASAPLIGNGSTSGRSVAQSWTAWPAGSRWSGAFSLTSSAATPVGTYAIRTRLTFDLNGTTDRLESRGWFSAAVWASATETANGTATLNLSRLGVAGILPETAVQILGPGLNDLLVGLVVAAIVLVGAGAYLYFRRGPGSSSGVEAGSPASQAPSAFGRRRRREGDSRNS
ncbi:MAG: hypothetical protein ACYCPV_00440 [Thermoplasmata archaeon]